MKSIISSQALLLMRPYKPILIGSAAYGNVHANDIDMLIRVDVEKLGEVEGQLTALGFSQQVPDPETLDPRVHSAWKLDKLGEVEGQLTALGFSQQVPDPETLDPRVHSAWKLEKLDIQLATPVNYESKVAAHREVLRRRLYKGLSKAARYALLCSLM